MGKGLVRKAGRGLAALVEVTDLRVGHMVGSGMCVYSLANFRSFLARPDAMLQILEHPSFSPEKRPDLFAPLAVVALHGREVGLVPVGDPGALFWLRLPRAEDMEFRGDEVVLTDRASDAEPGVGPVRLRLFFDRGN